MPRLIARELALPPWPLQLARSVAEEPGFSFLWSADGSGPSYIACEPIEESDALDPEPGLCRSSSGSLLSRAPRWMGALPYEAFRTMERPRYRSIDTRAEPHLVRPRWCRYGAVAVVTDRVTVVGDDGDGVARLCERLGAGVPARPFSVRLTHDEVASGLSHRERIESALQRIFAGDIYQVNLARRFELAVSGRGVDLLAALSRYAPAPFAAALSLGDLSILSSSPELLLAVEGDGRVWTAPIKGTRPRGADAVEDERLARELDADPKECAELWMIVDVERNDLGRVAKTGSVRVLTAPRVRTFGPVHHRLAVVGARLAPSVTRAELLFAVMPSGSVTGAPKVRAMELIAELESERRGLYTGGIGYIAHDGGMRLSMAIRTLTVRDGVGHYSVGGGIVADSEPLREVTETRWKARQLIQLFERFRVDEGGPTPHSKALQNLAALAAGG